MKNIELTVKPKLRVNRGLRMVKLETNFAGYYGSGIQTICVVRNSKVKCVNRIRNCDDGSGPFNCKEGGKSKLGMRFAAFFSYYVFQL